jgi:hypothetical protein
MVKDSKEQEEFRQMMAGKRQEALDGYAAVVAFLDGGQIVCVLEAIERQTDLTDLEAIGGFLMRLRDVLTLRGWGAPLVGLSYHGRLSSWERKVSKDADVLRIVFDAEGIKPETLPALYQLQNSNRVDATFVAKEYQPNLMPQQAATDFVGLAEAHAGGQHFVPDTACPDCLLEAAERRLKEADDLGEEGGPDAEAERPDLPGDPGGD